MPRTKYDIRKARAKYVPFEEAISFDPFTRSELRKICNSGDFVRQIEIQTNNFKESMRLKPRDGTVKQHKAFLAKLQNTAKRLLELLEEGPIRFGDIKKAIGLLPLKRDGLDQLQLRKDLQKLIEETSEALRSQSKYAKLRRDDQESLWMVKSLFDIFEKFKIRITESEDGALCKCLEMILESAGYPLKQPRNLLRAFKKNPSINKYE